MKNWKRSAEEILTMGPVVPVIVIERLEDAVPLEIGKASCKERV